MKLIDILLKLSGKNNFNIDPKLSRGYLFKIILKYGLMLGRGVIYSFFHKNVNGLLFKGKNVCIIENKKIIFGNKCKLYDHVYIDAASEDGVRLGDRVSLGRNSRIECTGSLACIGRGITIGSDTTFADNCFFGSAGGIVIGENVVAGQYVRFHSENHEYDDINVLIRKQGVNHKGIKIGNNCWIGAGAVFLDGAELGDGCVVGANAVVTKKIPANCIIAGVPAKVVRTRGKQS